jgi:hypothetical protein
VAFPPIEQEIEDAERVLGVMVFSLREVSGLIKSDDGIGTGVDG